MFKLIKTLFLMFMVAASAILIVCGGTLIINLSFGFGGIFFGGIAVLILLLVIYNILRSYFGVYIWRSFFLGILGYAITTFVIMTILNLVIDKNILYGSSMLYVVIPTLTIFLVPLYILTKIFQYYRIKANEPTVIGTVGLDISSIFGNIFRPFINFFRDIQKTPEETIQSNETTITEEKSVQTPEAPTINSESADLMSSLGQVDITNISGITFLPKVGKGFQVKTSNVKRLAVYVTTNLGKTTFEAEELRSIYNHVIENLQSNLSKTDFNIVQGKINEFVQSGGEVKIEKI